MVPAMSLKAEQQSQVRQAIQYHQTLLGNCFKLLASAVKQLDKIWKFLLHAPEVHKKLLS